MSFDGPNLVANAGLLLVGTLVARLGLEQLVNATVRLGGRVGGAPPGRKVLTLVPTGAVGPRPLHGVGPRAQGVRNRRISLSLYPSGPVGFILVVEAAPWAPRSVEMSEGSRNDAGALAARRQIGVGGFTVSERAKALVREVLDSGRLTAGPMMSRFEQEVARLHDCRFGLMCNSGTSALQIALGALREVHGWRDGDEVLVPAVTFVATSNVVLYNGLTPVFVDVDPVHFTIDPARIEERITPRTRAIMPVHVGGLPCDMDPILEIARAHDLRLVEDSCEAMFAKYRGRPVGSFSDIAAFSTYAAHIVTTGVGGVCTTSDPELIMLLQSLMNHGRDNVYIRIDDDRSRDRASLFETVNGRFSFVRLGHSFRASEMEAAVGVAQLEEREEMCARRREIAARYDAELADLERWLQLPRRRPDSDHAYMFYAVVVTDPRVDRDDLVMHLEQRSVETRYLLPLINQPVYRKLFGDLDSEYPVAARLNENAFYVGCHPEMTDDDVDQVIASFQSFFGARA